jgi:CheY-like chemotaxis protein
MNGAFMANLDVLIIEDKERWQSLFKALLKKIDEDVNIAAAYFTDDAEPLFENNAYDLIILDLKVPKNESFKDARNSINLDLLKKIRKSPRNKLSAIIITSGYGKIPLVTESLRNNKVYNFLEKGNTFDNSSFIQNSKEAILQSRVWKFEKRQAQQYRFTIQLNKNLIIGCEVSGPKYNLLFLLETPVKFNCDEFARSCDDLNLFFLTSEGVKRWRPAAKAIGKQIFDALFNERLLLENLTKTLTKANSTDDVWICVQGSANALGVPFELMHNEKGYLSHRHIFTRKLNGYDISNKKGFHQFIDDLGEGEKLRVLIVGSNSDGTLSRVEEEIELVRNEIEKSLNHIGIEPAIACLSTEEATHRRVSEELKSGEYHILHFSGHGEFVRELPEESGLWLLDESGNQKMLNALQLYLLTLNSNLQFVFLNCCLSARTAGDEGRGEFYGIFDALARAEVPAVLGYRWTVLDKSALQLARKFYQNLWCLLSLEEALHTAKHEIKLEQGLDDEIWASPILLLQKS